MEDDLTKVAQASARGGFFLISGTAIATIISAIGSILIARFLGSELYGQYALALVAPQLLYLFTDLGLNQALTKFTAQLEAKNETHRIPTLINHAMLARITIGSAIFALNYIFAGPIADHLLQRPELAFYIQISSMFILFNVIFTASTSVFVGLDKTEYQAITTNTQALAKTIASVALILAGLGITGAIIGFTISYMATAAVAIPLLWLIIRQKKTRDEITSLRTNLKALFQYGTPLYISVLLTGFLPLFNNLILAFFATDTAIGNYKAAINFATLLLVLAGPITTVLLPAFSKLNQTTTQKIRAFFKISVKYTTMIIIPVTVLIIVFSEEIVQIIYGQTYQSAALFLSTYSIVYFLVGAGYLTLPSLFNGLGETKTTLKMGLTTFLTLLILAIPLAQAFTVQGVIAALLIANTTGILYGALKAKRKCKIEYDVKNTAKIYLVSIISAAPPLLLKSLLNIPNILNLLIGGILYMVTYVTLMPLTNIVNKTEIQNTTLATKNIPILKQVSKPILNYQQRIIQRKTAQKHHTT